MQCLGRFNAADPEALKPAEELGEAGKKPKNKSGLQKKFEEKKAEGEARKSDKEVLEAVITEISAAEKAKVPIIPQWL